MIPVILGAVALGATGYGVSKLLADDEFRDDLKDKIQDMAIKGYEGIETLEEKMGLNEYTFPNESISKTDEAKSKTPDEFDTLYQLKVAIRESIKQGYNLTILDNPSEIKKDKTKDITITEQMMTNKSSYEYILKTAYSKIKQNMDNKTDADIMPYMDLLKDLFVTKIIKKGELNDKSTDLIIKGMYMLSGRKQPMFVDLSAEVKGDIDKHGTTKTV